MFFAIAGFLSGALLVVLFNENAERANELLKDTINNLEEDIDLLNSKIKNRDRMIEKQQDCKYVYEFRAKDSHLSKQQASEFLLNNMGENSEYVLMHQHIER